MVVRGSDRTMAQMVHHLESEKLAYDHMLAEYRRRRDGRTLRPGASAGACEIGRAHV